METGSAGTRTRNQRLKRALLYRLSYRPTWNKVCKPDQTLLQEFAEATVGRVVNADSRRELAKAPVPSISGMPANRATNPFLDLT